MTDQIQSKPGRYRKQGEHVIIEVAVRSARQLFNERDPAPFRDRDLDNDFAHYILSSVQEFPLKTPMIMKIAIAQESDQAVDKGVIRDAIKNYFEYESGTVQAMLKKRMRVSRFFLLIGLLTLFICLSVGHLLSAFQTPVPFARIVGEGFTIVGWVAMWWPLEGVLYDWWPLREQKQYLAKISSMDVVIECSSG